MKGVIIKCLQDLVETKFGGAKWQAIVERADAENLVILVGSDVPDTTALAILDAAAVVLGITPEQAADAFGLHWMTVFAPRIYSAYFQKATSARDFLLRMDEVHAMTTKSVTNAKPPHFHYEWEDDNTLLMTYESERGLINVAAGLARGVGAYFKESLDVTKLGGGRLRIRFPH